MLVRGLALSLALALASPQARDPRTEIEALQKKIALLAGDDVRRETDPAVLAASLGHDPAKIFAAVRGLDFHPYPGALRGGLGTLLAGSGNDVDRCLLLKDLLELAPTKPNLRFAFGELKPEQADALVARALQAVPTRVSSLPSTEDVVPKAGETDDGLAAVKASSDHLRRVSEGFVIDRDLIHSALKEAGMAIPGVEGDTTAGAARRLRDHVWLQAERDGKWIDLDPSFVDAAEGWAPVAAARTAPTLPAELYHRLGVRLVLERKNDAALESETLYSTMRNAADLAGRAIHLTVLPDDFRIDRFTQSLEKQAVKFDRFQPVVTIGGVRENGRVFDVKGRVFQSKDGKLTGIGDAAGGRVLGGLGRKAPGTSFSGLRLEVDAIAPGGPARTTTRYLLNRRATPVWNDEIRYRIALIQAWSIWPATGPLNDAFFVERLGTMLARDGGVPGLLLDHVEKKKAAGPSDLAARLDPLPLGLIGVAQSALALSQGELEPGEGLVFNDRPSILFWKEAMVPGKTDEVTWRGGVDLAQAPLGVVAKTAAAAARARMTYGILLTEGESSLMADGKGMLVSAASKLRVARAAKSDFTVVREPFEGLPPAAAADLKAGHVLVLTKAPARSGAWWRLDPATGECLGIGDTGEGQAVSEGVLILDNISIPMVDRCMKFVVCLNVGVGMGGASMADAGRECMTEFMKDFVKDTLDAAIKQFVLKEFQKDASAAGDRMMQDLVGPEYFKLYEKARRCYGNARDVGGLRKRVDLLLKMGNDIAKYAGQKAEEARRNR